MLVYKCVFTKKDVFSDAYKVEEFDDIWYIITGKYKNNNFTISDSLIGGNKSAEAEDEGNDGEEAEMVWDLIDATGLEELACIHSKEDVKKTMKKYLLKLVDYVETKDTARAAHLKKILGTALKPILKDWRKMQFFATQEDNFDLEGIVLPMMPLIDDDIGLVEGTQCKLWVLKDALETEAY